MASTTFEMADEKTVKLMEKTMKEYHGELFEYELKVGCIAASGPRDEEGNLKKAALLKAGTPCAAKVKVVQQKDRLTKGYDVEVTIDQDYWKELDEPRKIAILDHELEHIQLVFDADGNLKRDHSERPRCRTIADNINYWGFSQIAERHGKNSQEVLCFQKLLERHSKVLNPAEGEKI